jgi:uncharacterized lipoprotein YmbA
MKSKVDKRGTKDVDPASGSKHLASHVWRPLAGICLLAPVVCLLASCNLPQFQAQPDATRYFLLTSTDLRPETSAPAAVKHWVVGVRAVDLSAYLHTKAFAIRSHANEVAFLDFTRWAEPLDQGIARVLAEDLEASGNVARVVSAPFRTDELRDFEVGVRVTACEGTADGDARFTAAWRIVAPGVTGGAVAEGSYVAAGLRWDGRDHAQLAARLSEAVAGLSRDIAAALPKDSVK